MSHSRNRFSRRLRWTLALAVPATLALALPGSVADAAGSHVLIEGSGSSWAQNAVNQWIADVQSNGIQVVFT